MWMSPDLARYADCMAPLLGVGRSEPRGGIGKASVRRDSVSFGNPVNTLATTKPALAKVAKTAYAHAPDLCIILAMSGGTTW